jgi:Saxitoxin biosynthesis operon protein SxtJ
LTKTDEKAASRRSALTVAAVLLAIGAWQIYRSRVLAAEIFIGLALLLALISVVSSRATLAFHRAWMRLAEMLGYVNSRILLSAVFYGLFTPIGLLRRVTGNDPLTRRSAPQPSYWEKRSAVQQTREGFERAF